MTRIASCVLALMVISTLVVAAAIAQTITPTPATEAEPPTISPDPVPTPTETRSPQPTTTPAPYPNTEATAMDAERAKIWNSPAMLRGRAWLHDYCARSAKVTPAQAEEYMTELRNMSPSQMKLWLLKFQEQEEMIHQQQAMFNAHRQAGVQQAQGVEKATQQAYADINQGENEKAQLAEQSLDEQNQFAQQRGLQKSADRDYAATMNSLPWGMAWANQTPWGPYAGYPMGGPGPMGPVGGAGHYHIHYHIAPPAAAK
jgi:hypothetical protein